MNVEHKETFKIGEETGVTIALVVGLVVASITLTSYITRVDMRGEALAKTVDSKDETTNGRIDRHRDAILRMQEVDNKQNEVLAGLVKQLEMMRK